MLSPGSTTCSIAGSSRRPATPRRLLDREPDLRLEVVLASAARIEPLALAADHVARDCPGARVVQELQVLQTVDRIDVGVVVASLEPAVVVLDLDRDRHDMAGH